MLGDLRVGGFPLFTVITVLERFSCEPSQQQKPFSHRGRAVTIKERDVVREIREKERERRALLSCVGLSVSFEFRYSLNMVCLWNEGVPSFLLCHLVCVNSLQVGKEGVHHLSNESWPRLEGVASPSSALSWWKEALNLFWCLPFS